MAQLDGLIKARDNDSNHNNFNDMQLNFQLKAYKARLSYLRDLREALKKKDRSPSELKIDDYFGEVLADVNKDNK